MTKVIHVIWSATIGGIEKIVIDLVNEQKKNQLLQPAVLIAKREGGYLDKFKELGITVYYLDLKSGWDFNLNSHRKAIEIFNTYDVIHIHSFNPLIADAAKKSHAKIVYTEHGNFGFGKRKTIGKYVVSILQKRFLNSNVDAITFNSNFSYSTACRRYGLKEVKKEVIYNGIVYKPIEIHGEVDSNIAELLNGNFVVGTIARMAGVKRIDRLLKSYSGFQKNKATALLLIGDGPLLSGMKILATNSGIEESTIFAGYRENTNDYLKLMDVFVLSSQNEAFGLVAIEAYSEGKPVIAFNDGGGITELVTQIEQNDIVADESQLAERLSYYYNNKNVLSGDEIIERRKAFARKFDIKTMEKAIFNLYMNC